MNNPQLFIIVISWGLALFGIFWTTFFKYKSRNIFDHPFLYGSALGALTLTFGNHFLQSYNGGEFVNDLLLYSNLLEVFSGYLEISWLIISFAYLAYSLDKSGFFEYCANKISINFSSGNWQLHISIYILVSLLTFFTTNDIVILAMTPIIVYLGRRLGIKDMVPILLIQYYAANILSMGLYIGSPTNVVIGDSVNWTFVEYAKRMLVPTLTSFTAGGLILMLIFRKRIKEIRISRPLPKKLEKINRFDMEMAFKSVLFGMLLMVLSFNSLIEDAFSIWQICSIFAFIAIVIDCFLRILRKKQFSSINTKIEVMVHLKNSIKEMPWTIIPFLLSMGVLVKGLSFFEYREFYTNVISNSIVTDSQLSILEAIKISVGNGFFSALTVNLMNDIPSSLFLSEITNNISTSGYNEGLKVLIFTSILVGLNPGVGLSISGALAGLMWMGILSRFESSDVKFPTVLQLTIYGAPAMLAIIFISCFVNALYIWTVYY